jgi:hypothetical protein
LWESVRNIRGGRQQATETAVSCLLPLWTTQALKRTHQPPTPHLLAPRPSTQAIQTLKMRPPVIVDMSPFPKMARNEICGNIEFPLASTVPELVAPSTTISALVTHQTMDGFSQNHTKYMKKESTCEISSNISIFSSPIPSTTSLDATAPSNTIVALETRSEPADFIQNHQKTENLNTSPFFPKHPPTLYPSIVEHTNDETEAYASPPMPNDIPLSPSTLSTSASSPKDSHSPAVTTYQKSELLGADFETQSPPGSLAPLLLQAPKRAQRRPNL